MCFSGGETSALVALNVWNKYPNDEIVLLNHNINNKKELPDVKRFKKEISDYIGIPITYANINDELDDSIIPNQFDVCKDIKAFKVGKGTELCTYHLKTKPFYRYLETQDKDECVIYYGFDKNEEVRVQRRISILGADGWVTDYPFFFWNDDDLKYKSTLQIGIKPPAQYDRFKHANCIGCLKAGKQHWYVVYCLYPEIYKEAIETEEEIGYSILKDIFLEELIPLFEKMRTQGISATEKIQSKKFWNAVKSNNLQINFDISEESKPCLCTDNLCKNV